MRFKYEFVYLRGENITMAHRLENDVNNLVEKLIADYEKGRDIDIVETFMHPNKDEIINIIEQIRNIIFPGYYKNYRIYTVRNNLSMQLEDVLYNLSKQISIVLKYLTEYAHTETGIDIHPGATLGKYFFIDHSTGIVIGGNAFITTSILSDTRVSIKNQELEYKQGGRNTTEIVQSEEWYYII